MSGIQESVSAQDAVAPATPAGAFPIATARAEGAGFPAVTAGDAVAPQATVAGLPLGTLASPSGDRYQDIDAHDDAAPAAPRGAYQLQVARAVGAPGAAVTAGDATAVQASTVGVPFQSLAAPDLSAAASVVVEDAVAPVDPTGIFDLLTARAEGAGFPAVTAGDAVSKQGTVAGLPLVAQSSPSGDRFTDVDAHDDAAPANPRGTYPLTVARAVGAPGAAVVAGDATVAQASTVGVPFSSLAAPDLTAAASVIVEDAVAPVDPTGIFDLLTARAEGAGFPAVTAGDAVSQQGTVAGVPLVAQASPSGDRFADVDAHDDAAPAAPRGGYTLDVARAEGTPSAAVVDGDAVAPTTSLNAVRYAAITDSALSRVADVDAENEPGPAAPRGLYAGGRATTASPAFTDGDYTPANFDLSGRQRVTVPNPGNGKTAIHVTFTNAALAAGTSTQTVHTGTASRETKVTSVVARYVGTTAGVTLQLLAGGQRADIAADNLTTDKDVNLLGAGRVVYLTGAETLQVVVTGATLNDTLEVRVQGEEETA